MKTWLHACLGKTERESEFMFLFQSKEDLTEWGWRSPGRCSEPPLPLRDKRLLSGRHSESPLENGRVKTPARQLFIQRQQQHMRCSQCGGRPRTRCALLVRSYHHHTPRHLRHLPAVSPSDNSRGYPRGYCYRETWGRPSEVNFGRVLNVVLESLCSSYFNVKLKAIRNNFTVWGIN